MAGEMDVLDECGLRTGEILSRSEVHRLGKPHRVVRLYLFDRENRLLLQRRSDRTDHGRGFLTISVLGHLDAGESSGATVRREMEEELGLDPARVEIEFLFSYRRDAELRPDYIDRQFNDIYAGWADFRLEEIVPNRDEVSEVVLVTLAEFQAMTEQPSSGLAPYYRDEFRDLSYLLRDRFASRSR